MAGRQVQWVVALALLGGLAGCAAPPKGIAPPPRSVVDTPPPAARAVPLPPVPDGQSPTAAAPVVASLRSYLGVPYRYGGKSRSGIDCSALTGMVYRAHGVRLPRTSRAQAKVGRPVERAALRAGDLVFFHDGKGRINHCGMVSGPGRFIHASTGRGKVVEDRLDSGWATRRFAGARRLLADPVVAGAASP